MSEWDDYLVMPEKCRWINVNHVSSHEMAYLLECTWFNPKTRIAVMNIRTGETKIFIREIDTNGNLVDVIELKGDGTL